MACLVTVVQKQTTKPTPTTLPLLYHHNYTAASTPARPTPPRRHPTTTSIASTLLLSALLTTATVVLLSASPPNQQQHVNTVSSRYYSPLLLQAVVVGADAQYLDSVISIASTIKFTTMTVKPAGFGGCRLDVADMTAAAASQGLSAAQFQMNAGLVFGSTLVIDASGATAWTNGATLNVVIRNGYAAQETRITTGVINITGSLRNGSSVHIEGGLFVFAGSLVYLQPLFGLYDRSTLTVTKASMGGKDAVTTGPIVSAIIAGIYNVNVDGASEISILNNLIVGINMTAPFPTFWYALWFPFGSLYMSESSKFTLAFNNYTSDKVTTTSKWEWYVINVANELRLQTSSSFNFHSNLFMVTDLVITSDTLLCSLVRAAVMIRVESGSTLMLWNNTVSLINVTVPSFPFYIMDTNSAELHGMNVGVIITNNSAHIETIVATSFSSSFIQANKMRISTGARLEVDDNRMTLFDVQAPIQSYLSAGDDLMSLWDNGTIQISYNNFSIDGCSVEYIDWIWLRVADSSPISLTNMSSIILSNNHMKITNDVYNTAGLYSLTGRLLSSQQVTLSVRSSMTIEFCSVDYHNIQHTLEIDMWGINIASAGIVASGGSSITMEGFDVKMDGVLAELLQVFCINVQTSSFELDTSSTATILTSNVFLSNATIAAGSTTVVVIRVSSAISIGNASILKVEKWVAQLQDINITGSTDDLEVLIVSCTSQLLMPVEESDILLTKNEIQLSNVVAPNGDWNIKFLLAPAGTTMYLRGRIRVDMNRVALSSTIIPPSTTLSIFFVSFANSAVYFDNTNAVVGSGSPSLSVVNNMVSATSTSATTLRVVGMWLGRLYINGTSMLDMSSNAFALNATIIQSGVLAINSNFSMSDNSSITITSNTLTSGSQSFIPPVATGNQIHVLMCTGDTSISSTSSLKLLHNSISGPYAHALSVANINKNSMVIETCRNYVNGSLCVVKNGMYACQQPYTPNITFPDCHTDTTTLTPSPLTSTVSPIKSETQPHTLSSAHTPSSTIVPTPTQWSPTPLPPSQTHTLPRPITKTVPPTITRIPPLPSSSSDTSTSSSTNPSTSSSSSASEATSITTGPPTAATSQMSSASSAATSSSSTTTTTTSPSAASVTNATALPSETSSATTAPPVKLCNITCYHTSVYVYATDMVATSTADPLPLGAAVSAIAQAFKGGAALPPLGGGVCSKTTSVPFSDTQDGATTRRYILVHTNGGSSASLMNATAELANLGVNTSDVTVHISMAGVVTSPSSPSTAVLYGVEMRRTTDENALGSVPFGITLPPSSFGCTPNAAIPSNGYPSAIAFKLDSPPSALSENEKVAVAVMAMAAADLQTLAAIGLLRCSPGASDDDEQSEASIRALVPVALSGTCAGAVQGALVLIVGVLVISVVLTLVLMRVKKVSWTEAATTSRCPGIVIVAWAFVQMGFVVCGGRLVSSSNAGDVGLGLVGMLLGLGLPVLCVFLAWGVVSRRCYRIAPKSANTFNDDPKKKRAPTVVRMVQRFMLPMYELDTKCIPICKAYSTVVGKTRRPSCIWAALPTIQPVIMAALAFSHGYVCSPLLVTTGVVMMLLAAVCYIVFRPHRIFTANFLQGIALILNSLVLMVAAKLVEAPLDITALSANRAISYIQMGLSVFRTVHTLGAAGYMHLRGAEVYERVSADGASLPPEAPGVPALPEHVAQPVFEYIAPCLGGAGVLPPSNSNAYDSESIVKKPDGDLEQGFLPAADDVDINLNTIPPSSASSSTDAELEQFLEEDEDEEEPVVVVAEEELSVPSDDGVIGEHPPMSLPIGAPPTMDLLPHRGYVPMVRPYELIPEEMLVRVEGDQDDDGGGATTTTAAWIKYTSKEEEGDNEGAAVQPLATSPSTPRANVHDTSLRRPTPPTKHPSKQRLPTSAAVQPPTTKVNATHRQQGGVRAPPPPPIPNQQQHQLPPRKTVKVVEGDVSVTPQNTRRRRQDTNKNNKNDDDDDGEEALYISFSDDDK